MRNSKFLIALFFISLISISNEGTCTENQVIQSGSCDCAVGQTNDCESGQICHSQICYDVCQDGNKPDTGKSCLCGTEVCSDSKTCINNNIYDDCTNGTKLTTNQNCLCGSEIISQDQTCVNGTKYDVCASGDDNQPKDCRCKNNYCKEGQICDTADQGTCTNPTGCTNGTKLTTGYCLCGSEIISQNQICHNNKIYIECAANSNSETKDCKCSDQYCNEGQICATANQGTCTNPSVCTNGTKLTTGYCLCGSEIISQDQTCVNDTKYDVCASGNSNQIKDCRCSNNYCKKGQICATANQGTCTNPTGCTNGTKLTTGYCLCGSEIISQDQTCLNNTIYNECSGQGVEGSNCQCGDKYCNKGQKCTISNSTGTCENINNCVDGGNAQEAMCKCSEGNYCQVGEVCSSGVCSNVNTCADITGINATEVECTCGNETCLAGYKCNSQENKCTSAASSSSSNKIFKILLICTLAALF